MAGKPDAGASTGRRTSTTEQPCARCNFFATGAFCPRLTKTPSTEKRVARPRNKFACARLCSYPKKTSQCYGKRHDRGAARITAKLDPESKMKKAILLAGGAGTRLFPLTKTACKLYTPIFHDPMTCNPLGSHKH